MSRDRRSFLALAGSAATVAMAGCNSIVGRSSAQTGLSVDVEDASVTVGSGGIDDVVVDFGDAVGHYDNPPRPVDAVEGSFVLEVEGESKGAFYTETTPVDSVPYLAPDGGQIDYLTGGTSLIDSTQAEAADFEPSSAGGTAQTNVAIVATFRLLDGNGDTINEATGRDSSTITVEMEGGEAVVEVGGSFSFDVQG